MSPHRQLAAIMFTDIEGYTALMQENEQSALATKDRHRDILQEGHQQFNGSIVQYYGDGTLSIFQSVVEAVQCAIIMQQTFRQPPVVPVRIGLHIGDIIMDREHVFGDGVNVASRIESLGVPGCVLISDKVADEIRNHPEIRIVSTGTYQFKNVVREMEIFALDHDGLVVPAHGTLSGKTEIREHPYQPYEKPHPGHRRWDTSRNIPEKSIAVLPFVNMSNDSSQEYFSDGIAEEILNALTTLPDLKIAGRTSSFQFKGKNLDLREVGEILGVSTVLEGSVRKQGNRLRITAQLISVADGFHLWSERYDRNMDDIFAIQDEIALAITEKLKVTLLGADPGALMKVNTLNTEAYELYLKGRYHINRRGASILTGHQYFERAIALDPDFALAHTGYADASLMAAFYGLVPPLQVMHKAKAAAETALRLDPSLCEPYCSLGCYYTCYEWNWEMAEIHFLKSLELNPGYTQAHNWFGSLFLAWTQGNFQAAEEHGFKAVELDPQSAVCHGMYASILQTAGKFREALAASDTGTNLDGHSFISWLMKGWAHLELGAYDAAIGIFENLMKGSANHHFAQNALIIALCRSGNTEKAAAVMDDLLERSMKEFVSCTALGLSSAHLNRVDEAFGYLEAAFTARDPMLLSIKYEHWVPSVLRQDPRFQKLIDRIGFPEVVSLVPAD